MGYREEAEGQLLYMEMDGYFYLFLSVMSAPPCCTITVRNRNLILHAAGRVHHGVRDGAYVNSLRT